MTENIRYYITATDCADAHRIADTIRTVMLLEMLSQMFDSKLSAFVTSFLQMKPKYFSGGLSRSLLQKFPQMCCTYGLLFFQLHVVRFIPNHLNEFSVWTQLLSFPPMFQIIILLNDANQPDKISFQFVCFLFRTVVIAVYNTTYCNTVLSCWVYRNIDWRLLVIKRSICLAVCSRNRFH